MLFVREDKLYPVISSLVKSLKIIRIRKYNAIAAAIYKPTDNNILLLKKWIEPSLFNLVSRKANICQLNISKIYWI